MLQIGRIKRRYAEIERWTGLFDQRKTGCRAGAMLVQYRRGADPKRKGEIVAESIGEKQLRLGIEDIVLAYAQGLDAEALAGDRHVAMAVHRPFRRSGGAGRIEPETIVVGGGRRSVELRLALCEQCGKRLPFALGTKHAARRPRGGRNGGFDLTGIFRRVDKRGRGGIVDHERVAARPQQRVERNRYDAGFDRTPEQIERMPGSPSPPSTGARRVVVRERGGRWRNG